MKKEHNAGVLLFRIGNNEIKYLILKYQIHTQNHWDFVKGGIENNETLVEAAKREVLEETGIKTIIIIKDFKEQIKYTYKKDHGDVIEKDVIYLLAETNETEIRLSEEHSEFKWATKNEVLKVIKFEEQKNVLKKADSYIKEHLMSL